MNQLNVNLQHSIATLTAKGWSARKIARELGLHRETVGRYLGLPKSLAKPAIAPAGSPEVAEAKPAIVPAGSKAGRASQCVPFAAVVQQGDTLGRQSELGHEPISQLADYLSTVAHTSRTCCMRRRTQSV